MRRFQRARNPDEKEVRRKAILRAARELALKNGPVRLGLNELGRRSGVSKPNIYRYFESREQVLLHLFVSELEDCVVNLESSLASFGGDTRAIGDQIARSFLTRPLLCQLLGLVSTILEHNLSAEAIASAKRDILALSARFSAAIGRFFPWLSDVDAIWIAHTIAFYIAGLWPAAHPSKAAAEVLGRPEFASLKPDAPRDLCRLVQVLLAGVERQSPGSRPRGRARPKGHGPAS